METEFVIYLPRVTPTFLEIENIGGALCVFVLSAQGRVWAGWEDECLKVRIQKLSASLLRVGIQTIIEAKIEVGGTLSIIEKQVPIAPLPDLHASIPWGTIMRPPRLTKKLMFLLPRGAYLLSHRGFNGISVFAEKLGKNREGAWQRAIKAKAVGRRCCITWSATQFCEERFAWPRASP